MGDHWQDVERLAEDLAFEALSEQGRKECDWPGSFGPIEIAKYRETAMYLVVKGWSKP